MAPEWLRLEGTTFVTCVTSLLQQGRARAQGNLENLLSGQSCSLHRELFFLRREMGFTQANAFPPVLGFIPKDPPCPSGKLPDLTGEALPWPGCAFKGMIPAL